MRKRAQQRLEPRRRVAGGDDDPVGADRAAAQSHDGAVARRVDCLYRRAFEEPRAFAAGGAGDGHARPVRIDLRVARRQDGAGGVEPCHPAEFIRVEPAAGESGAPPERDLAAQPSRRLRRPRVDDGSHAPRVHANRTACGACCDRGTAAAPDAPRASGPTGARDRRGRCRVPASAAPCWRRCCRGRSVSIRREPRARRRARTSAPRHSRSPLRR